MPVEQERPDHPDFEALLRIIRGIDLQSESGFTMEQIAQSEADLATLLYAATHRARMAVSVSQEMGVPPGVGLEMVRYVTLYLEAFIAGCRFARQKTASSTGIESR